MTAPVSSSIARGETTLHNEWQRFKELFAHLRDALLNRLFDLRPEKAVRRRRYLVFLFLLTGFLISLREYPLQLWAEYFQDILSFIFVQSGTYVPNYAGNPFTNFFEFGYRALADPHTVQYLPLLLASFFIALQSAAIYLADIFELDNVGVARKFVSEVALSGSDETIRITQGDIFEEHRSSPNYLIGGPGKVVVDIDSVALFEMPDGTPRVIGPTGKETGGKATLSGFERFRQAIDLRDHYTELRDPDGKFSEIKSRSLDGIRISATDVKFVFSVQRKKPTMADDLPYSFTAQAIERLIYRAVSKVSPEQKSPSTLDPLWVNGMIGLIRGKLGGFMSGHKLTEYLASIGKPEYEKAKKQEEGIAEETQKLAPAGYKDIPKEKDIKPPPDFTPREQIKDLFSELEEDFKKATNDLGLDLHWIGVGTWKAPPDIKVVTEKHLDAWELSRENIVKGSDNATRKLIEETVLHETMKLIQDVPIWAHNTATEEHNEHIKAMRSILKSYQQQLIEARDFINAKATVSPEDKLNSEIIQQAINNIIRAFGHGI